MAASPRQYPPANRSATRGPQETDLRPSLGPTICNHPGGTVPGRKHARDGVAGPDAVPFGRAALALDLPSGRMRTVAVAWTPSTERREPGGEAAAAAWPASREKLVAPCPASRRGTERNGRPPAGRWGLGASGRQATCRSWTLTGSAPSRGRSTRAPHEHGWSRADADVDADGGWCRRCDSSLPLFFLVGFRWSRQSSAASTTDWRLVCSLAVTCGATVRHGFRLDLEGGGGGDCVRKSILDHGWCWCRLFFCTPILICK